MNSPRTRTMLALGVATVTIGCGGSEAAPPEASVERFDLGETVQLTGEFTNVSGIRELSDGTVWVSDNREDLLRRIAVDAAPLDSIARVGDGPMEYRSLERLFALGGDTTAIYDGNQKLLFLYDGAIVRSTGRELARLGRVTGVIGMDTLGGVFLGSFGSRPPRETGEGRISSSFMDILQTNQTWENPDSVARLEKGTTQSARREPGGPIYRTETAESRRDGMALFPDGWLAIVRADPYAVEWIGPDGATSPTSMLTIPEGFEPPAVSIAVRPPIAAPGETLIVPLRENEALGDSIRYDVVSRGGSRIGYLVLPTTQRIVGAGIESLYLVSTDPVGLQRIHRAAWPPTAH